MSDWPNDTFLSARNIRRACDASLRRLQTDYIDLYQMHHVDRSTPWDEIWEAMEVLRQQGKIMYVGSSNLAGWHIAKAQESGGPAQLPRPGQRAVALQPGGTQRRARGAPGVRGLRPRPDPWSPLYGGLLGGVFACGAGAHRRAEGRAKEGLERHRDKIEQYEEFCDELGRGPGERRPRAGCCTSPRSPRRSSGRARSSSSTAAFARWRSGWTRRPWPGSTRSSRDPVGRRRRPTPGEVYRIVPTTTMSTSSSKAAGMIQRRSRGCTRRGYPACSACPVKDQAAMFTWCGFGPSVLRRRLIESAVHAGPA